MPRKIGPYSEEEFRNLCESVKEELDEYAHCLFVKMKLSGFNFEKVLRGEKIERHKKKKRKWWWRKADQE